MLLWSNVSGRIWLALKNAATKEKCCLLGSVFMILPPLPPCLADEESRWAGDKPCCHHLYWVKQMLWEFWAAKLKLGFPIWEGNVAQIQIFWSLTSPWQTLCLSWPLLLVFHIVTDCTSPGNGMCCWDPLLVFFLSILCNSKAQLQGGLSNYVAALHAFYVIIVTETISASFSLKLYPGSAVLSLLRFFW